MSSDMDYIVRDLQRRLANMIRRGIVHSVDFDARPPRLRVEYAKDAISGWLPWVAGRVGHAASWEPIKIGEPVLILSESGEMSAGVVVPSFPGVDMPMPDQDSNKHVTKYEDGTTITYDRAAGKLTLDVVKDISIIAADSISVQCTSADVNATENVTVTAGGDVLADGSNIKLNGGAGVVTGACICPFTGSPHSDTSSTVFAGK